MHGNTYGSHTFSPMKNKVKKWSYASVFLT